MTSGLFVYIIPAMKIGDVEIKGKVVLGPMAGITSLPYREFMKGFGVALSYSEMISDCGLIYGNEKTEEYVATSSSDRPVGLQLFGHSAEHAVKGIAILEKIASYDILDINLGCPVHKVVKTGAGSAWLKNPPALYDYMKAICEASHKPVTAKIRLGWDDNSINVFEVAPMLEKAGVKAITVHCRTSTQMYSGKADYHKIAGLKEKLSVPLIISGDIFSVDDVKCALEVSEADMVMVARGAVGHPFLVKQIDTYLTTGEILPDPALKQQVEYALTFAKMLVEDKGEDVAIRQLKGIIPHFLSGFPGYKKVRLAITQEISSLKQLEALLSQLA